MTMTMQRHSAAPHASRATTTTVTATTTVNDNNDDATWCCSAVPCATLVPPPTPQQLSMTTMHQEIFEVMVYLGTHDHIVLSLI